MVRLITILLASFACFAQVGTYQVVRSSSLTATTEAITIQMGADATKQAKFISASVYCSAACVITIERDGTAATNTAITPSKLNSFDATVTATAYRSSNVGTAARTVGETVIPAGGTQVFEVSRIRLLAGENVTFRTDSITATVKFNIQWEEL